MSWLTCMIAAFEQSRELLQRSFRKEVELLTSEASESDGTDRCGYIDVFDVEEKLSLEELELEDRVVNVMEEVFDVVEVEPVADATWSLLTLDQLLSPGLVMTSNVDMKSQDITCGAWLLFLFVWCGAYWLWENSVDGL